MKLGFLTAPFPETPLNEVADWAASEGFEVLEIACWPRSDGPTRRYAGTSHIDVQSWRPGSPPAPAYISTTQPPMNEPTNMPAPYVTRVMNPCAAARMCRGAF